MKTEEMDFSNFTRVDAGHACDVEVIRSDSYSVSITARDNIIKSVKVVKEGGTLKIRRTLSSLYGLIPGTFRAKITMPVLNGLNLSGASKGSASGFSSTDDFTTDLKGASSLNINMSAGDIKFKLAGASKVTGQMTAGDAEFNLNGASKVELEGSAINIVIDAAGASHVDPVSGDRTIVSDASTGSGRGFETPLGIAVETDGSLVVADRSLEAVVRVDPLGGDRTIVSGASTGQWTGL